MYLRNNFYWKTIFYKYLKIDGKIKKMTKKCQKEPLEFGKYREISLNFRKLTFKWVLVFNFSKIGKKPVC